MNTKKPGLERPYTHREFLRIIESIAKERKLDYFDQLDYFNANDDDSKITDSDISFRSDTHWGGSEGVYTNYLISGCGRETYLFTAKTLGESKEDYIKMHVLAANICLIASEYVRTHDEEFNWNGYDVSYIKDGEVHPYMWCATEENALKSAQDLKQKGYSYIVRDNATRETVSSFVETEYKGQRIVADKYRCHFYLYNADTDIDEYRAKDIEDAKAQIDSKIESLGGLYNADGELVSDL